LRAEHIGHVVETLRNCTSHAHDRDALMQAAFNGIGSLKMRSIRSRRSIHQPLVEAELKTRADQEALYRQQRAAALAPTVAATPPAPSRENRANARNDLVSHGLGLPSSDSISGSEASTPTGSPVFVPRPRRRPW
jgi:hypothetical protein